MSEWNQPYLEAAGVSRWILREIAPKADTVVDSKEVELINSSSAVEPAVSETAYNSSANGIENEQSLKETLKLKSLVTTANAKFALLVGEGDDKKQLQIGWKQLKMAWKLWRQEEFPASLYQISNSGSVILNHVVQTEELLIDCCSCLPSSKFSAPKLGSVGDKKKWWLIMQVISDKIDSSKSNTN